MRRKGKRRGSTWRAINRKKILQGGVTCLVFAALFFLCSKRISLSDFLLRETLPGILNAAPLQTDVNAAQDVIAINEPLDNYIDNYYIEETFKLLPDANLIGVNDIEFQPETDPSLIFEELPPPEEIDMTRLDDLNYLRQNFYIVDKTTQMTAEDFDVDQFMQADLSMNTEVNGPKVLIFHTHGNEMYSDSAPGDLMEGVMGLGFRLAQILTSQYGIETMHHTGHYDKNGLNGAYERMEPDIRKILEENPTIEVALDLHRDGVTGGRRLVTTQNGVPMAQVMFFNGLCKQLKNGELRPYLSNPYVPVNLALSFRAHLAAKSLYPDLCRRNYLKAYRYSLHMLPKSMLIEVGAQTNTKEEALNAMEPLAEILANVLLG